MKKIIAFVICLFSLSIVTATRVVFIENYPYSTRADNNNISFFLMENIFKRLGLNFEYEYVSHSRAMQMIDEERDVVIFPFIRPRNMSIRILLSDTLYVRTHKVFYDSRIYSHLEINRLEDLRTYITGSHPQYPHETALRIAGLTVHYSHDNAESMQKLVDQQISFVIEERIRGLRYLEQTTGANKRFIRFYDADFFPVPFFAVAAVANETASGVIERINEVIADREFMAGLIGSFFR